MAEKPDEAAADDRTEVDSAVGTLVSTLMENAGEAGRAAEPAPVIAEEAEATVPAETEEKAENDARKKEKEEAEMRAEAETNVASEADEAVAEQTPAPPEDGARKLEEVVTRPEVRGDTAKREDTQIPQKEITDESTSNRATIEQVMVKSLMERNAELEEQLAEMTRIAEEYRRTKESELILAKRLKEVEAEAEGLAADKERALAAAEDSHREELIAYKEQIRQHSLTIVAMEDRVSRANRQSQEDAASMEERGNVISALEARIRQLEEEKENQLLEASADSEAMKMLSAGRERGGGGGGRGEDIFNYTPKDIYAMEQLILLLRRETADFKVALKERDETIIAMRRDLQGAQAKLSDMTGELSEEQKVMMEDTQSLVESQSRDLASANRKLSSLSAAVETQTREIESLNAESTLKSNEASKLEAALKETEKEIKSLREELEEVRRSKGALESAAAENQTLTKELANLGAQCRGERHAHVIQRQREALSEMRGKIRTLEVGKPPTLDKDEALQRVAILKRELSELRAQQAVADNKSLERVIANEIFKDKKTTTTTTFNDDDKDGKKSGAGTPPGSSSSTRAGRDAGVTDRMEMMTSVASATRAEMEMEKSAHRETIHALEMSERTYFNMVRGTSSILDLDAAVALKSMAYVAREEREKLFKDRQRVAETIFESVKALGENLRKSEGIVHTYSAEFQRLKDVEEVATRLKTELETMAKNLQREFEENKMLKEALRRAKESLNFEKRLNASIKEKKQFYVENPHPHHHRYHGGSKSSASTTLPVPPLTSTSTAAASSSPALAKELEREVGKRKSLQESTKRKDEEIRTLKMEMNKMRAARMEGIKKSGPTDRY